jgi:SAM-dependent methyltransferase
VAYAYDTDKSQLYLDNYERHFCAIAHRNISLLELGVHKGGSLLMWRDFFQNGKIAGLDLEHVHIEDPTGRIDIYKGDQRNLSLLDRIRSQSAPEGFDIIIDDASHIGEFTKISFWHLFETHLKPGGCYVIEDWRLGYWPAWPDGKRYRSSDPNQTPIMRFFGKLRLRKSPFRTHSYGLVGLVKQLVDELGMDAITNPTRNGILPQRSPRFRLMEICPGQIFIVKATQHDFNLVEAQWRGPRPTK